MRIVGTFAAAVTELALLGAPAALAQALPDSVRSADFTVQQRAELQAQVHAIAARAGVSERALASVAERLGVEQARGQGRLDVSDILNQIEGLAGRVAGLEAQLARLSSGGDAQVEALLAQVRAAVESGDLDSADALLGQAGTARAQRSAQLIAQRAQLDAQIEAETLGQAEIIAAQADVRLLRGDYRGGAALYAQAAERAPESAVEQRWEYRMDQGWALLRVDDAQAALDVFTNYAAPLAPRETSPENWARTQSQRGVAYMFLGTRGGPDIAIQTFNGALSVLTRDGNPFDWGVAQMNLGHAYRLKRERGDRSAAARSLEAYEAALTSLTPEREPYAWAQAQESAGSLYLSLAAQGDVAELARSITAYQNALIVSGGGWRWETQLPALAALRRTRDLARTLDDLGGLPARDRESEAYRNALTASINMERAYFEPGLMLMRGSAGANAITACEAALNVLNRERTPEAWAIVQMTLGAALFRGPEMGSIDAYRAANVQSINAYEAALSARTREAQPALWAHAQFGLQRSLYIQAHFARLLGDAAAADAMLARSEAAYDNALLVWARERDAAGWARATLDMAYQRGDVRAAAEAARAAFEEAGDASGVSEANGVLERLERREIIERQGQRPMPRR